MCYIYRLWLSMCTNSLYANDGLENVNIVPIWALEKRSAVL